MEPFSTDNGLIPFHNKITVPQQIRVEAGPAHRKSLCNFLLSQEAVAIPAGLFLAAQWHS